MNVSQLPGAAVPAVQAVEQSVPQPLGLPASDSASGLRVAAAQFAPALADVPANVARVIALFAEAVRNGAGLVVFPECALTGYNFPDRAAALACAIRPDGAEIQALIDACRAQRSEMVVGTLLADGGRLLNVALLLGPEGIIGRYDKAHLPFVGADKFADRGDTGFKVFQARAARIGMLICYDLRFPEAARALALAGAEIIVLPTNWPLGAESAPGYAARARANENRVFVVACNRVGYEEGAQFIGRSCIIAPNGAHLADASSNEEHIIIAGIDPTLARNKRVIVEPGVFEMDFFGDRRPDLYGGTAR
ncbi:MAG: carbon-nitrogen hydrolase family protein [Thermoflexales bacterium]|nr:carbon-nitrogen hydrolase family protein [Thermoflexales bacterium]